MIDTDSFNFKRDVLEGFPENYNMISNFCAVKEIYKHKTFPELTIHRCSVTVTSDILFKNVVMTDRALEHFDIDAINSVDLHIILDESHAAYRDRLAKAALTDFMVEVERARPF